MITTSTGFGFEMTDEFGYVYQEYEALYDALKAADKLGYFTVDCPSVEDRQLIFGIYCNPSAYSSLDKLLSEWNELLAELPESAKVEFDKLGTIKPDFVFLAGEC